MSNYETTVRLPSGGVFYPEHPDLAGDLVMRMMNTSDEKKIFGSTSEKSISDLIRGCITNVDFDPDILVPADRYFLLLKLRVHTYGADYHIEGDCPSCQSNTEIKIDMDDMPVYELDEDFEEPMLIELPLSKDEIGIRILRTEDANKIRSRSKRLSRDMNLPLREVEYMQRMARQIISVNGEDIKPLEADKYFSEMMARDSAFIKHKMDQIQLGYDDLLMITCPDCGEEYETPFRMTGEFFRPRFD